MSTIFEKNSQALYELLFKWMPVKGALSYSFTDLCKEHQLSSDMNELDAIAWILCGTNADLAIDFMAGGEIAPFMENVRYNSEKSAPYIMRAVQIRMECLSSKVSPFAPEQH